MRKKLLHDTPHILKVVKQGSGDPVVVLHGQISTHRYMQNVAKELSHNRTVYSFDLLGYGDSPRPKQASYTVGQHVASIHKTLQEHGVVGDYTVLGHSMGAQLALAYTARYKECVKAAVISGIPLFESPESGKSQLAELLPKKSWYISGKRSRALHFVVALAERPMAAAFGLLGTDGYPRHVLEDNAKHSWQSYSRSMDNVVFGYNPTADIKALKSKPIIFIFGKDDPLNKEPAKKLQPVLGKKHQLFMVEGGHHTPLDHPKVIANKVLSL